MVVVVVVVTKSVVEVTIVEVDSVVTITGWWVSVTTAKKPCPGGEMKSDLIHQHNKRFQKYQRIKTFRHESSRRRDRILDCDQIIVRQCFGDYEGLTSPTNKRCLIGVARAV